MPLALKSRTALFHLQLVGEWRGLYRYDGDKKSASRCACIAECDWHTPYVCVPAISVSSTESAVPLTAVRKSRLTCAVVTALTSALSAVAAVKPTRDAVQKNIFIISL